MTKEVASYGLQPIYTLVTCRLNFDLLLVVSNILRRCAALYVAAGYDPDRSMIGGYNLN